MEKGKKIDLEQLKEYIDAENIELLNKKYEFYSYNHAIDILAHSFRKEFKEIIDSLINFTISIEEVKASGGNESNIPKKFSEMLKPLNWNEIKIEGELIVKFYLRHQGKKAFDRKPFAEKILENYIEGHYIDYLKNRVALDIEWNSKDQTYDRDLLAFRTFYECDVISVGIVLTRAEELNDIFRSVTYEKNGKEYKLYSKYGASTTHINKLLERLDSRRNGGCPILAIGIKKECFTDWSIEE